MTHNDIQFEMGEMYKFVKFADGHYEFSQLTLFSPSHRDIAETRKQHQPVSAGLIRISKGHWVMADEWSSSLLLGATKESYGEITKILGLPLRDGLTAW